MVHRVRRVMWRLTDWRQADHYVTTHRRSSRLFPRKVFYLAGDPTRGFVPVMVHRVRRVMWRLTDWRQADHYVTRPKRSSCLFPKGYFIRQATRQGVALTAIYVVVRKP